MKIYSWDKLSQLVSWFIALLASNMAVKSDDASLQSGIV